MFFYDDEHIDHDLLAEARAERARARSFCHECRHSGGHHAVGCPNEPEPEDEPAVEAEGDEEGAQ